MENFNENNFRKIIFKKYQNLLNNIVSSNKKNSLMKFPSFFKQIGLNLLIMLTGSLMQSIVSFLTIVIYVISTYYDGEKYGNLEDKEMMAQINVVEIIIAFLITLFFITNFFIQKKKIPYLLNTLNLLDILTVIPIYLKLFFSNSINLEFTKILRLFRLARATRIIKMIQKIKLDGSKPKSKKNQRIKILGTIAYILFFIFFASGLIHYLNTFEYFDFQIPYLNSIGCENNSNFNFTELNLTRHSLINELDCGDDNLNYIETKFSFDIAFYYMIVTITTVGYGDIIPMNVSSRFVIGICIVIGIIFVAFYNDFLMNLFVFDNKKRVKYEKISKYFVITGFFDSNSLKKCIDEIFHQDNKEKIKNFTKMKVIVIQHVKNKINLDPVINNPLYDNQVHLFKEEDFSPDVLRFTNIKHADAVFILSDSYSRNALHIDYSVIMMSKIFTLFPKPKLFVQTILPKSFHNQVLSYDHAFSTKQLKYNIIIKNSFIPGLSTIFMNLISNSLSLVYQDKYKEPWFLEYINGATQIIRFIPVKECFIGTVFREIVKLEIFGSNKLVIGVKHKILHKDNDDILLGVVKISINPQDYILKDVDELIVISNDNEKLNTKMNVPSTEKLEKYRELCKTNNVASIFLNDTLEYKRSINNTFHRSGNFFLENESVPLKNRESVYEKVSVNDRKNSLLMSSTKRSSYKIWKKHINSIENLLEKHYLVISREQDLEDFMLVFSQECNSTILFLSISPPSNKWDKLSKQYPNLYYIHMKNMNFSEFSLLNTESASHVYFLTTKENNSHLYYTQILPTIKLLRERFDKVKLTIEVPEEIHFKSFNTTIYSRSKTYSTIFRQNTKVPLQVCPQFTKSEVFISSYLDSLLPFSYFNEYTIEVILRLLSIDGVKNDKNLNENCDFSVMKYIGFDRISYGEIIYMLVNQKNCIIPIGIYRNTCCRQLRNTHAYVVTNPNLETFLNHGDKVICIGKLRTTDSKEKNENEENKSIFSFIGSNYESFKDKFVNEEVDEKKVMKEKKRRFIEKLIEKMDNMEKSHTKKGSKRLRKRNNLYNIRAKSKKSKSQNYGENTDKKKTLVSSELQIVNENSLFFSENTIYNFSIRMNEREVNETF